MLLRAFVTLLCAFSLLPLAVVLLVSLTGEGFARFPPERFSGDWYLEALEDDTFVDALVFSVTTAAVVAVITAVVGALTAIAIVRLGSRPARVLDAIVMSPLLLAHVVLGIALLNLFAGAGVVVSPYGLIAGHVLVTTPFVVRLMVVSLRSIPQSWEWASASLGASGWYTFRRVILPSAAPGAIAGVAFAFLISFDEVTIALFMAVPERITLPVAIFRHVQESSDPLAVAVSGWILVLSGLVILLLHRRFGILRLLLGDVTPRRGAR
jgi:putative spermidine/putrescine transport system permease protein